VLNNLHKILIVHTWGIGDWLFFTPVITALKETWPDVNIDVILGTPNTRNIVELYPEVHIRAVTDVRKGPGGILKAVLKTWYKKYDALVFTAGIDSRKADKLAFLINAKEKLALRNSQGKHRFLTKFADYDMSIHRVENNLKLLDLLGVKPPEDIRPFIHFKRTSEISPQSLLIHPGSDAAYIFKRWPVERFAALSEKLLEQGCLISVLIGPAEVELAQAFVHLKSWKRFTMYQNVSFLEVLNIISVHEILLNSDSGLGHLAAALGRKVISIFGPGDPIQVRPYGKNCTVIRTCRDLGCMPCMCVSGLYGCSEAPCVADIDVRTILKTLESVWCGTCTAHT